MFVKIRVVQLEYHASIYCLSIVASALYSFQDFLCCRNYFFRHLVVWLCSILGLRDTWGVTAPVQGPSGSPRAAAGGGEADQRRVDFWS